MSWLDESLNRKFAAGTAAGLLVSSLVFLVLFVSLYRGQLEHQRTIAATQVTRLLQSSLENAMLKRDLGGLQEIVDRLGGEPGVRGVMIANARGDIRLATDPNLQGARLPLDSASLSGTSARFIEDADGRPVLRSSNTVHNQPQCEECHGPVGTNPINGILYVDFDADPIREHARATTLLLMGAGALIVLINLAGGWWFIRRFVIQPVRHLSSVSERLSEGELGTRAALPGADELSRLGGAFNRMAESLGGKIAEIKEHEQFLQELVDAIPEGIRVIDQEFRVVLSNASYRAQLGFDEDRLPPEHCYSATHARDAPCPESLITCPLREVTRNGAPLRVVHRHTRLDGTPLDVELYAAPMRVVRDGAEQLLVVEAMRDLDQEVRFSHEQKLSELGRLAAGVAHEIHNPLASVRMALHAAEQAVSAQPPDPDEAREYLTLVDQEVDKCIEVTERLLKLSVPALGHDQLVRVDRVVADTLKLLQWEAETRGVAIDLALDEPPLRILGSDSELRMSVLNLAQNALHAMPNGGKLAIRCQRRAGDIEIRVEDTGIGIDPADRIQIFEPFFSRRADGIRGTGLGLSIVKSIVESHGGTLSFDSEPGRGTRFVIALPAADIHAEVIA